MLDEKIMQYDIVSLHSLLKNKKLSSVDLVNSCLESISSYGDPINAFVNINSESALEQARRLDRLVEENTLLGPLHGIPIAVKDNYTTKDMPTTAGSNVAHHDVDNIDAEAVSRLRDAGAVIIGKTNMHEWAYGATNELSAHGPVNNPWNTEHISGGSSGGSGAALAARFIPGALGSDTGGSIRIPASACGVSGLKPSYGRVSRRGVLPLSWSMDVAGPMARSAKDLAVLFSAISDCSSSDKTLFSAESGFFNMAAETVLNNLKVAVLTGDRLGASASVESAFDNALSLLTSKQGNVTTHFIENVNAGFSAWDTILHSEASSYHQDIMDQYGSGYFPATRTHLEAGRLILATEYLQAQKFRKVFTKKIADIFSTCQIIAIPTLPVTAPKANQKSVFFSNTEVSSQDSMTYLAWIANFTGFPVAAIPCGFDENGLPIGLSLMGPPNSDMWLLAVAEAFQKISEWHKCKPRLQ